MFNPEMTNNIVGGNTRCYDQALWLAASKWAEAREGHWQQEMKIRHGIF
jgi:hypothetical protein